jgi:hypothetical protein
MVQNDDDLLTSLQQRMSETCRERERERERERKNESVRLSRGTAVLRKVGQLSLGNDLDDNTFPYSTLYCVLDVVIHITTLHPPCIRSELRERERKYARVSVCV